MRKYCGYKLKKSDLIAGAYLRDILKSSLEFNNGHSAHQWDAPLAFCSKKLYYSELFQELIRK